MRSKELDVLCSNPDPKTGCTKSKKPVGHVGETLGKAPIVISKAKMEELSNSKKALNLNVLCSNPDPVKGCSKQKKVEVEFKKEDTFVLCSNPDPIVGCPEKAKQARLAKQKEVVIERSTVNDVLCSNPDSVVGCSGAKQRLQGDESKASTRGTSSVVSPESRSMMDDSIESEQTPVPPPKGSNLLSFPERPKEDGLRRRNQHHRMPMLAQKNSNILDFLERDSHFTTTDGESFAPPVRDTMQTDAFKAPLKSEKIQKLNFSTGRRKHLKLSGLVSSVKKHIHKHKSRNKP